MPILALTSVRTLAEMGVDNRITVLGYVITAQTARKIVIWFGVIGVLLCSIVGSGILSMQEGAHPLDTRQPPAATSVAILPSHTPTTADLFTATPTFAPTWTPSPTVTVMLTPTATPSVLRVYLPLILRLQVTGN